MKEWIKEFAINLIKGLNFEGFQ